MAFYIDPRLSLLAAVMLADNELSSESEDSSSSEEEVQMGRGQREKKRYARRKGSRKASKTPPRRMTHDSRYSCPSNPAPPQRSCRGYVLVIVNYDFPSHPLYRGNDIEKIWELFQKYGYQVRSFTNRNRKQIRKLVGRYSKKEDSGSLICFISSHGDQTSIACPDGSAIKINDILKEANTVQLGSRPKVFFIDACRSSSGKARETFNPVAPAYEYFIGFSCQSSKTSVQLGSKSCGIYFEALIEVFKDGFDRPTAEFGKTRDITHFMEKVNYMIGQQRDARGQCYQLPMIHHTLSRRLFLQGQR